MLIMAKRSLLLLGILTLFANSRAQHYSYIHHTERNREIDSTSLQHFFQSGQFFGHSRFVSMGTYNKGELTDYHATGFGMGIGYETAPLHRLQLGISGFFIYNLVSSDLQVPDTASAQPNRYEVGLFDVENPGNHHDLDRLEDLYLKYSDHRLEVKFGKQHIRTPFINPQDGRMRPTLVQGVLTDWKPNKHTRLELGWISEISPRSTVRWFQVEESFGLYGVGRSTSGARSGYKGNMPESKVIYAGFSQQLGERFKLNAWNQTVTHVFNTEMLELVSTLHKGAEGNLKWYAMGIAQQALEDGGNADPNKTYMDPGQGMSLVGSTRLSYRRHTGWEFQLNYTRIADKGRYLMPREWGRDPFYTFLSRERNEGYADVHAYNAVVQFLSEENPWSGSVGVGMYKLPDANDAARNKYGFPAYCQTNASIYYMVEEGFFKGIEIGWLGVYKKAIADTYDKTSYILNKVNVFHHNVVFNYHF